jgi:hypothetical protein
LERANELQSLMEPSLLSEVVHIVNQEIHLSNLLGRLSQCMVLLITGTIFKVNFMSHHSIDTRLRPIKVVVQDIFLVKYFVLGLLALLLHFHVLTSDSVSRVDTGAS